MAREPIYMPKYGMTMTEGIITEWHFREGDDVNEGDALLTVETEKVDTDIEAPVSGKLVGVRFDVDAEVPVGEIIAYIEH
jgi:pyruvate dehydrogenase E2 component (dihydrolipoamide acetyltransferase)